ncbi:MAG: glycosyltransferase family 4 protein [Sphaerochaeta sp.]
MRILVVSQYYFPEQMRITDICETLVLKGHQVSIVTGIPNYPQGKFYEGYGWFKRQRERINGVEVYRLPIIPRGKTFIGLSLNYLSFVFSGWWFSWLLNKDFEIVFNYEVSPMTQCLVGIWLANRKKIPCVSYITDLWPESVQVMTGITSLIIIQSIQRMVDSVYNRSTRILTSSNSFIESIIQRGISQEKIEFWPQYAEDFYQPLKQPYPIIDLLPQDGKLHFVFAGNIGIAQGLEILIHVAEQAKKSFMEICFVIIGDGRAKESLQRQVADENLNEYFLFIGKQPATKIPEYLACADAALVVLKKSSIFSKTIPAKVQSYLACGIPVIVSADGEIQQVVKEAGAGFIADSEDVEGLFKGLVSFSKLTIQERESLGYNAKNYSESKFSKEKLICRLEDIFQLLEQGNDYV